MALVAVLLGACGDGSGSSDSTNDPTIPSPALDHSDRPWKVVVSLPVFEDFVREMGGDQVEVTAMIPPGANPHTYVPPEEDAALIEDADLVLVNGLGLDQPTIDFIESHRPDRRLFMVDFVRDVPSPSRAQPIGGKPIYAKEVGDNPHLFLDPVLVPVYAETVSHSLVILDDENEPYYDALFARYKARLADLHDKISADMTGIPEANRRLVVTHDSMVHWANRYGLEVGLLPAEGAPAVFTEVGIESEADIGADGGTNVEICELQTDSIADPDTTYIEMMERNSEEIASCLGG